MRKQKNNLNSIVMKTKLTNEQIHLIEQNVNDFSNLEDKDKSLEANLAAYYMSRVPDVTHDEAMEIVSRLKNGITTFNTNLADALKMEEVDYSEMIERVMQTDQISNKSVGVGQPNCNGTSLKELYEIPFGTIYWLSNKSISLSSAPMYFIEFEIIMSFIFMLLCCQTRTYVLRLHCHLLLFRILQRCPVQSRDGDRRCSLPLPPNPSG